MMLLVQPLRFISPLIEKRHRLQPFRFISPLLERRHRLQPSKFISPVLERRHRLQPFRFISPLSVRLCRLSQIMGSHLIVNAVRDEVFPYVNTHRLKTDGIIKISSELFQSIGSNTSTTFKCIINLSAVGLRKLVDFPIKGECRRIVPPSEVEAEFLKQTSRKYKKDAWQDIAPWFGFSLTHSQPRSEGWVMDDFKKYSLEGHPDGYALDKQVRLVINQVQRMVGKANRSFCSTTLVLLAIAHVDPRMADYRPDWSMWVSSDIRSRLGRGGKDKFSGGKFREG
ncbi:hypothetical protein R1flu_026813 [Riccia fluitans]|uniref:Uncharacterized protein n=1 Tax=Riccia fluitans TaxID=41844 RepID=A0ABD1XGZ9_9MARC